MVIDSTIVEEGQIWINLDINNTYIEELSYIVDGYFSLRTILTPDNADFLPFISSVSSDIDNMTITKEENSTSYQNLITLPIDTNEETTLLKLTYLVSGDISSFFSNVPTLTFHAEAVK